MVGWGFSASDATAVSNLPAIFFWASKAPRMAGTGHMGFSPRLWGLLTRGSKPSSGFGAGVSPELGSASHPKFLLTPAFKGFSIAGCACAQGPCRSQAESALKVQEKKREMRSGQRCARGFPAPQENGRRRQWAGERRAEPRVPPGPCSV